MARFNCLDEKVRSEMLKSLSRAIERGYFREVSRAAALGSEETAEAFDVASALPLKTIAAIESGGPSFVLSRYDVVPVTRGDQIVAFVQTRASDALGAAPSTPAIHFPNYEQIALFMRAKDYVESNFGEDASISLLEHRPLQLKALQVSESGSEVFVVYQAASRVLLTDSLPIELSEKDMVNLLIEHDAIQGIVN